ncbi:MAG: hypothetical protein JSR37_07620 [Verrucomicrobia bacterium]|nr:hypothetical protein [Verrucomicrobiota bacterium]MBS0636751.1 hypothetical protein [Verrucomicrobiota bacterium]
MMQTKRSAEDTFCAELRRKEEPCTLKKTKKTTLSDLLRTLTLDCSFNGFHQLHLKNIAGDEALLEHVRQFERLDTIEILDARELTDYSLTRIIKTHQLYLRVLDLSFCPYITDKTLFALQECYNLEQLSLCGTRITDKGIKAVVRRCRDLKQINLDWCPKLTGMPLLALARHCPNLETASFIDNRKINDLQLIVLKKKCLNLSSLVVDPQMSPQASLQQG